MACTDKQARTYKNVDAVANKYTDANASARP